MCLTGLTVQQIYVTRGQRLQKTLLLPPQRGSLVPFQGGERIKRSSLKVLPSGVFPAANLGSRFSW